MHQELIIAFVGGFSAFIIGYVLARLNQRVRRQYWELTHPNCKWEDWH